MLCLGEEVALVFASGVGLASAERSEIERHLDECGRCRRVVAACIRVLHESAAGADLESGRTIVPGRKLGRYVIERAIGAGRGGLVYEAHDPELQRRVAIKVLHRQEGPTSADTHVRVVREARAMAQIAHAHVVRVFDVGSLGDTVFIVMELVPGETLTAWLESTGRSWREILAVFVLAGRGLAAAHAAGVVHRDFKPDNVLVDGEGVPRVTDFSGTAAGTPAFMAPEQIADGPVDARSDQFSFCVALSWALYGSHPLDRDRFAEMGPRAALDHSDIPPRLREVLAGGLAEDPARRFASVDELLARLRRTSERRLPRRAAAVAVGAAAAAIAGALFLQPRSGADPAIRSCTRRDPRAVTQSGAQPFCFSASDAELDWSAARDACAAGGGVLAGCEADWACEHMSSAVRRPGTYWIGLLPGSPSGDLGWLPGLPPSLDPREYWAAGAPPPSASAGRCVASAEPGRGNGNTGRPSWSARDCTEKHPYLCRHWPWAVSPRTGHAYRVLATPMTWDDAQRVCVRLGMHLATVADEVEQRFLVGIYPTGVSELWIGASDREAPGGERWVTGEPFTFRGPVERDNWRGRQHCLALVGSTGRWHDRECDLRYLPLCEMEPR